MEFLTACQCTVKALPGNANGNADFLSRLALPPTAVDFSPACWLIEHDVFQRPFIGGTSLVPVETATPNARPERRIRSPACTISTALPSAVPSVLTPREDRTNASHPHSGVDIDVGIPAPSPVPPLSKPPCLADFPTEGQLPEFLARYSHRDQPREQQANPSCYAPIRYFQLGHLAYFGQYFAPVGTRPPSNAIKVYELARKATIYTIHNGIPLTVRHPTPQPGATSTTTTGRHARLLGDESISAFMSHFRCTRAAWKAVSLTYHSTSVSSAYKSFIGGSTGRSIWKHSPVLGLHDAPSVKLGKPPGR